MYIIYTFFHGGGIIIYMDINTSVALKILRGMATKQKSGAVVYAEFCEQLHRYAQQHVEEQPELVAFVGNAAEPVDVELEKLAAERLVIIQQQNPVKRLIFVIPYYIDKFSARYAELEKNPALPFPSAHELPRNCPADVLTKNTAGELLYELLKNPRRDDKTLYGFTMPMDMPTMIFPSTVPVQHLMNAAAMKISLMLQKEDTHEYFLKKLKISNAGKEISIKSFFTQFVERPGEAIRQMEDSAETYYFFTQLCFFIKKDNESKKDFTQEDINILQSITILEILSSFYKSQAQAKQQKETAFRNLETQLLKPPYYFDYISITKFTDTKGIPLLGQYTEQELKDHLHDISTETGSKELPRLLVFKAGVNQRYFIMKSRVMQLIVRLCGDARSTVKDIVAKEWSAAIRNFDKLPEMQEQQAFESRLEDAIAEVSPILHSVLHAPFLAVIYHEEHGASSEGETLFVDGRLIPYSDLLMLNRRDMLSDARIRLPFWYTAPVLSFFAALFLKKPKTGKKKSNFEEEMERGEKRIEQAENELAKKDPVMSKKVDLRKSAKSLEKDMVPEGSTLEREMAAYCHQWNKKLGAARENLTDDVNALVRDNMRKILRTMSGDGFTRERIANIAENLVSTPTLQKITKDPASLEMYIQLYLIQLVKGIR